MPRIKQPTNKLEEQALNLLKLIEHTATVEQQRMAIAEHLPAIEAVIRGKIEDVNLAPITTKEFGDSLLKLANAAAQLEELRQLPLDAILGVIKHGELINPETLVENGNKAISSLETVETIKS